MTPQVTGTPVVVISDTCRRHMAVEAGWWMVHDFPGEGRGLLMVVFVGQSYN